MATLKYLCIVGDIVAQADQAGLELLRAQSARVVLGGLRGGGRVGPGEASEGGATGHAATHTAVSVTVSGGRGGSDQGETGEEGEVVWGGAPCTGRGRDGGEGWRGGGRWRWEGPCMR